MDYRETIKKVVLRFGHTKEDREDFEQECNIAVLEQQETIDRLKPEDRNKYVYIICKNRVVDILRKARPALSLTVEEVMLEAEKSEATFQNMDELLDGESVTEYLNKLPEPYATILALRFGIDCDPRTQEEVAARFCKSQSWADKMEKQALEKLREMMKC